MDLFRITRHLREIHADLKEIKHSMATTQELLIETKKDLERFIQANTAQGQLVTVLQDANATQAAAMVVLGDKITALEAQIAAGGGDPAVIADLKAALAEAQQTNTDMQAGLQALDDSIEAAAPESPVVTPTPAA